MLKNNASLYIRMPNWLGDFCMALPIVRAITKENPETTLAGLAPYQTILRTLNINLPYFALPEKNWRYYLNFWKERGQYERAVLLSNSERSDLETWLMRIPKRYGIAWEKRKRHLLNYRFQLEQAPYESLSHQTQIWDDFTAHFGLQNKVDLNPFSLPNEKKQQIILICGSENTPEKRWPVPHWQTLIQALCKCYKGQIILTGSKNDLAITQEILRGLNKESAHKVQNLAGKTNLLNFLKLLASSELVVGNDTGGIHLANTIGIPVIGLYGPTNAQRTCPIYSAPLRIMRPKEGNEMFNISPSQVFTACLDLL